MKTIATLLLVAFMALSWSCGEAKTCAGCKPDGRIVCAQEENTGALVAFGNDCYMKLYNCLIGTDYRFLEYGQCPDLKSLSKGETESLDQAKAQ
ncbi:uncharacterized protein LOC112904268 isoform X4 [Agrilus planipennis]|uniref:Uncharacterized protein LOC112904268 isoform X3 n=1 Tax=Agrilus planipennis TaxID=224129 RepID=A0A7F5R387_AGRPL|nr:uncharacterized protein LOC112904268 isoform X3 [Agrilus planipennis]XP_025829684.1 uncharacterized protein LOC112904268 isoform X4 [Agrilus planipennis]